MPDPVWWHGFLTGVLAAVGVCGGVMGWHWRRDRIELQALERRVDALRQGYLSDTKERYWFQSDA